MMTRRFRSFGSSGSRTTATARFVNGPSVTSVTSPGRRRASAMITSAPWRSEICRAAGGSSA